jgi:hypothetical protein
MILSFIPENLVTKRTPTSTKLVTAIPNGQNCHILWVEENKDRQDQKVQWVRKGRKGYRVFLELTVNQVHLE